MKAGTPSATALLVAASVLRSGAAHGLPPTAIAIAARAIAHARGPLPALARLRVGRWLLALVERLVLPGLAAHHCARKAWIWARLQRRAIAGGTVVWAGVGFDGLGRALLHHAPGATVVETDHPDTLRQRRALLGDDGVAMRAVELPRQLDVLVALCMPRPTTLVCEGVAMYLPPRDVLRMLRRLAALPRPPRLIISALDTTIPGGAGFRRRAGIARRWLKRHGEPFRWRASPAQLRWCLAGAGYAVTAEWDGAGFGEYVVEAQARPRSTCAIAIDRAAHSCASARIHGAHGHGHARHVTGSTGAHAGLPDRGQ